MYDIGKFYNASFIVGAENYTTFETYGRRIHISVTSFHIKCSNIEKREKCTITVKNHITSYMYTITQMLMHTNTTTPM